LVRALSRGLRMGPLPMMPTTLVGSYPQPDWLIDRGRLLSNLPARVRMKELWRIPEPHLQEAQDDATALAGMDIDNPATIPTRAGGTNLVPRVVGPIRRIRPVEVDDLRFLRANTDRAVKITLPGPFTMSQQAKNEHYRDQASLALDLAAAVNEEVRDLFAAGADIVQIDEPWLQSRP